MSPPKKTDLSCIGCGVRLTDENWMASSRRQGWYRCTSCRYEWQREWRRKHPGVAYAYHRRYLKKHPEKAKAWARNRYWRDPEKLNEECKRRHREVRAQILEAYGSKCACCGEATPEFLEIDHVNNDGAEHRLRKRGNNVMYEIRSLGFPPEFQLLCSNCNMAKGRYGICPHQRPEER